eukprot:scaffold2326_cov82-Skeletonema_dohrnii-CCMP3373.AAC.3
MLSSTFNTVSFCMHAGQEKRQMDMGLSDQRPQECVKIKHTHYPPHLPPTNATTMGSRRSPPTQQLHQLSDIILTTPYFDAESKGASGSS